MKKLRNQRVLRNQGEEAIRELLLQRSMQLARLVPLRQLAMQLALLVPLRQLAMWLARLVPLQRLAMWLARLVPHLQLALMLRDLNADRAALLQLLPFLQAR